MSKKIILSFMTAAMVFSITPVELKAATHATELLAGKSEAPNSPGEDPKPTASSEDKQSRSEKRAERKKDRAIRKEGGHGGLYISGGAILIIIIVLIILL